MATPEHISTPRIAFYLTMAFAVAWLTGANVVMDSEADPHGYQKGDFEHSVWIAQQRALEQTESTPLVVSAR